MSWNASRIAFDAYQSKSSGKPTIEGISTRNAEYYGWRLGNNLKYTPDRKTIGSSLYDRIKSAF